MTKHSGDFLNSLLICKVSSISKSKLWGRQQNVNSYINSIAQECTSYAIFNGCRNWIRLLTAFNWIIWMSKTVTHAQISTRDLKLILKIPENLSSYPILKRQLAT